MAASPPGVLAALVAAFVLACLWGWGGSEDARTFSDALIAMAAAYGGATALGAASRTAGRMRLAWQLIVAAAFSWAFGEVLWTTNELLFGHPPPSPGLSDIGFVLGIPLTLVALLIYPGVHRPAESRSRHAFDALLISTSILLVGWVVVLHPIWNRRLSDGGTGSAVVSMLYPVTDTVLVSLGLLLIRRVSPSARRPIVTGVMAIFVLGTTDLIYAVGPQHDHYASGHLLEAGWFAGYLIMAWACSQVIAVSTVSQAEDRLPTRLTGLLPYAALVVATIAAVADLATERRPGLVEVGLIFLLVGTVLVRQAIAVQDTFGLSRALAAREGCFGPWCRARAMS